MTMTTYQAVLHQDGENDPRMGMPEVRAMLCAVDGGLHGVSDVARDGHRYPNRHTVRRDNYDGALLYVRRGA